MVNSACSSRTILFFFLVGCRAEISLQLSSTSTPVMWNLPLFSSLAMPQVLLKHFLHFLCATVSCELRITFAEFRLKGQPHTDVQASMGTSHPASSTWCQTRSRELYAVEATHNFFGSVVTTTLHMSPLRFCSSVTSPCEGDTAGGSGATSNVPAGLLP